MPSGLTQGSATTSALAGSALAGALTAGIFVMPEVELALMVGAGVAAAATASLTALRWRSGRLPLCASPHALRHGDVVTLRVALGHGRLVVDPKIQAQVDGQPITVLPLHAPRVLGPWTIRLLAPTEGTLTVTIEAQEGRRAHTLTQSWDLASVQHGQFKPLVCKTARGLESNPRWQEPAPAQLDGA